MPELFVFGMIGAIVTFVAVNLNLYYVHRGFQKSHIQILNRNLNKVRKYWSLEQGRVLDLGPSETMESAQQNDHRKATRSAFLFGTLMIFLSWLGLVLFLIYFFSNRFLVRSRMEQKIFSSVLVENETLDADRILALLSEMESGIG